MKHKMFLLAVLVLIGTYSLFGQKPTEEDPYLLWQTTDPLGYSGFVIHPNGNIIANRNCEFFEIDGNTGQQLRAFPVQTGYSNIVNVSVSNDGKYFASTFVGFQHTDTYIFEYSTGEVFKKLDKYGEELCFFPDSKRLLVRGYKGALTIYNLENETSEYNGPTDHFLRNFAISDDGKYIATGGVTFEDNEGKVFNVLNLWDAVTLKPIKQLDKIEGDNEVRSIKFSPDGKYVGFHVGWHDFHIYNLEDYNLVRLYNQLNVEFPPLTFSFLNSDLISFISLQLNEKDRFISIHSISNNILKYRYLGKTGFGTPAYSYLNFNSFNNSLVLNGGHLFAFDVNQMITTVEESPFKSTITVNYNKNSLILTDLNSISGQINITISDISGRVIRKLDSPTTNSELRIPLKLLNGTYLIHIQDGNQEYSSKFLVTE